MTEKTPDETEAMTPEQETKPSLVKNHGSWEHRLEDIENGGLETATARRQQIQQRDYADTMSGRDVPVITGFENAKTPAHDGKKKQKEGGEFGLTMGVVQMMDDADRLAQARFMERLNEFEQGYDALEEKLEKIEGKLDSMRDDHDRRAIEIDGERVYRRADGKWVDAEGNVVREDMQVEASRIAAEMKDNGIEVYTLAELMRLQEFETRAADIREAIESGQRALERDRQNADQLNKDEIDQRTSEHKNSQDNIEEYIDSLEYEMKKHDWDNGWSVSQEKPTKQNDVLQTPRSGLSAAGESEPEENGSLSKMSEDFGNAAQPKEPQAPAETTDADPETPKPEQGGEEPMPPLSF